MSEGKCKYNRPHCEQIGCDCFKPKHTKEGLLERIKAMSPEEQKLAVDRLFRALREPIDEPDIDSMTNEQVHQYLLDNGFTEKSLERLTEESSRLVRVFHSGYEAGEAEGWLKGNAAINPCQKIFDHKHLDPECVDHGCKSLCLPTDREARALLAAIDIAKAFMANVKDFDPATLDSAAAKLKMVAGEEE